MTSEAATSSPRSTSERRLLALLFLAYLLNFLDRQILAILKIPIKAELGLTDTQLGLMGGIAFAALYSTLAIPLARLADRRGRVKVIAGSVAVWSAATAVCGAATGFASLFVARMVVGIGEAGGVAPSHALIADRVPPGRRARAGGVFARHPGRVGARPAARRMDRQRTQLALGVWAGRSGRTTAGAGAATSG